MTSDVRLDLYQDSKKKSIVESITDIVIGFLMYLPINFFVLPMFADQIANQEIKVFSELLIQISDQIKNGNASSLLGRLKNIL